MESTWNLEGGQVDSRVESRSCGGVGRIRFSCRDGGRGLLMRAE